MQRLMEAVPTTLVVCSACKFKRNMHKHWLFMTTLRGLGRMASCYADPPGSHPKWNGRIGSDGTLLSRQAAVFPPGLAEDCAKIVTPLLDIDAGANPVPWRFLVRDQSLQPPVRVPRPGWQNINTGRGGDFDGVGEEPFRVVISVGAHSLHRSTRRVPCDRCRAQVGCPSSF